MSYDRHRLRGYHPPACTCHVCDRLRRAEEAAKAREEADKRRALREAEYRRWVAESRARAQAQRSGQRQDENRPESQDPDQPRDQPENQSQGQGQSQPNQPGPAPNPSPPPEPPSAAPGLGRGAGPASHPAGCSCYTCQKVRMSNRQEYGSNRTRTRPSGSTARRSPSRPRTRRHDGSGREWIPRVFILILPMLLTLIVALCGA